jgi:hypothetical protein
MLRPASIVDAASCFFVPKREREREEPDANF